MKHSSFIKLIVFVIIVFFSIQNLFSEELFIEFLEETKNPKLILSLRENKISKQSTYNPIKDKFYIGFKSDNEIILPINKDNLSHHFSISRDIEFIEDIQKITLNINYKNSFWKNGKPLSFFERGYVYTLPSRKWEDAIIEIDNYKIIDILLTKFLEISNYDNYKNIYQDVNLKITNFKTGNTYSIKEENGKFQTDQVITNDNKWSLFNDIFDYNIKELSEEKITLPTQKIHIKLLNPNKIENFRIIASNMSGSKEIELLEKDSSELSGDMEIEIPSVNYKNLQYSYKTIDTDFQTIENISSENINVKDLDGDYLVEVGEKPKIKYKFPSNYSHEKFWLGFWNNEERTFTTTPVRYKSEIKFSDNFINSRFKLFLSWNKKNRRKVILDDKSKEIQIKKSSKLIIIDLNHTNSSHNKKNTKEFKDFVNNILEKTKGENYFVYKFFSLEPSQKAWFDRFGINSINIVSGSVVDKRLSDSFQFREITKNNFDEFISMKKKKSITIGKSEVLENYYVLEPFRSNYISSINPTDVKEEINFNYYKHAVSKICKTYFNKKGYNIDKIYYITYYELFGTSGSRNFEFLSWDKNKNKIKNIIGG